MTLLEKTELAPAIARHNPRRVLLVEDDQLDAAFVQMALRRCGDVRQHEVTVTSSLRDARMKLGAQDFDVVLLDLGLPDSTGVESFVRVALESESTPIIVLSGASDPVLERECVRAGAQDFLPKAWLSETSVVAPETLSLLIESSIERHGLRQKLQEQERGMRQLLRFLPEGLVVIDGEGIVQLANDEAGRVLHQHPDDLVGSVWGFPLQAGGYLEVPSGDNERRGRVIRLRFAEGTWHLGPAVMVAVRDVTDERRREQDLGREVVRDPATGLPNKVLVTDRLHQLMSTAPAGTVGLILMEIGGAPDGARLDWTMREVASRIRQTVYPTDLVGRIADDLFAVVLEGVEDRSDAVRLGRRLSNLARGAFAAVDTDRHTLDVRVGVARSDHAGGPEALLRAARASLADACAIDPARCPGTNCKDRPLSLQEWSPTREELLEALQEGAFELRYQPIYAMKSERRVIGLEALARWHHPQRGWLRPHRFLDSIDREGLSVVFGEWTVAQALADAPGRSDNGTVPPVHVNVPISHFTRHDFASFLTEAADKAGAEPSHLVVELNEQGLLRQPTRSLEALADLRSAGVRVLLDDFGTGYSALTHLSDFPISGIKLDGHLIHRLPSERRSREIVDALITLARTLDLEVIAEEVETYEQLDALRSMGCPTAQGHLFSPPLTACELEPLLSDDR